MKLTVPLLMVHTVADAPSMVSATGSPDVAEAVATYAGPPTMALTGAVDVNWIVCGVATTAMSLARSFAALISPPPLTVASFATMGCAFGDTSTVRVIAGKLAPSGNGSLRVQLVVPTSHIQPGPLIC